MFSRCRMRQVLKPIIVALLLCLCAALCISCSSTPTFSKAVQDNLQKTLKEQMAKYNVPGAIVGIWLPDQGSWVIGSGKGDKSTGAAPKTTDRVRIGSLTKTFTATAVLQLVDQGKLTLDDKLSKYEPQVPGADGITLRQLLNMTSGLFNYTDDEIFWTKFMGSPDAVWTPQQVLDIALAHPPVFPPGQQYMYSNTNYILLGLIIEKVTGKPAGDVITTGIINKLSLKNTSFPMATAIPTPYMHGYLPAAGQPNGSANVREFSVYSPTAFWTAGGMISTLGDLKVWAKALATGEVVSKKMHVEQVKFNPPNTASYGLGVMGGGKIIGHSGEVPGYNSSMYYLPGTKGTSIVLINRYPSTVEGVADIINGELIKLIPKPAPK
jgi:D-alanyl-D-alanine carboxypeptidase